MRCDWLVCASAQRFADLANRAEARAFFAASARRIFCWWMSAAFLVVKALRILLPVLSRQSARYFP